MHWIHTFILMAFLVTTGLKCNMMKLHFQAYDFLTSLADWGKFWIVFEIVIYLYCQYEKKYNRWDHDYMIFKINHRYWNHQKCKKKYQGVVSLAWLSRFFWYWFFMVARSILEIYINGAMLLKLDGLFNNRFRFCKMIVKKHAFKLVRDVLHLYHWRQLHKSLDEQNRKEVD